MERSALFALVAVTLVSRLLLLDWNGAEYTDGIEYLSIDTLGQTKRLPVYPILVQAVHLFVPSLVFSGRLLSILMNTASVPLFYAITQRLYGVTAAVHATTLYIVSPVIVRWSIRVMPEATFTFLLLAALWCFIEWHDGHETRFAGATIALLGTAALTRPEGIGLLPLALALFGYVAYERRGRASHWLVLGSTPWILQALWHLKVTGRYAYGQELLQAGVRQLDVSKFLAFATLYPAHLPYVMTPIVFLCAVYGIYESVRSPRESGLRRSFHALCLYTSAVWLFFLSLHWAWTTRLLFPLIALLLVFSGYGLSRLRDVHLRRLVFGACVLPSVALTAAVLVSSRDKWADVRRTAEFARDNVPAFAPIVSSDLTKVRFWAERPDVEWYRRELLSSGTYVALQSAYVDVETELAHLRQHFAVDELFRAQVAVRNLLSDESNRLEPPTRVFGLTRHESVVLQLTPR